MNTLLNMAARTNMTYENTKINATKTYAKSRRFLMNSGSDLDSFDSFAAVLTALFRPSSGTFDWDWASFSFVFFPSSFIPWQ